MINPTGMRDNIVIWKKVYISMEFMISSFLKKKKLVISIYEKESKKLHS